jgi:hypothetical protein
MALQLKKATRKQVKLRLNLSSPSGAGKTMSALLMAKGLVNDWGKIAVIDTENGSASLYSHLGDFNTIELPPPFTPERYIEAIDACVSAGIECIIIDSSSHEWSGTGGCIEINEKLAQLKYKGNTWSAWNETTPRHDAFVNKVLQCNAHVITCTRSKMETVMGEGKKVHKVGMKDIQREGWEYELTISLNIDRETHLATASKDRTNLFEGKDAFLITEKTGKLIKDWCELGIEPDPIKVEEKQPEFITEEQKSELLELVASPYFPKDKVDAVTNLAKDVKTKFGTAASSVIRAKTLIDEAKKKEVELHKQAEQAGSKEADIY